MKRTALFLILFLFSAHLHTFGQSKKQYLIQSSNCPEKQKEKDLVL